MDKDKSAYTIQGVLQDKKTGIGFPDYTIKAFDVDHLTEDDFLGDARTDAQGNFEIQYRKSDFVKDFWDVLEDSMFLGGPDIILHIYNPEGKLIHSTSKRSGASRFEQYSIDISAGAIELLLSPERASIGLLVPEEYKKAA